MDQHGFQDLEGHIWELIYMEPSAVIQEQTSAIQRVAEDYHVVSHDEWRGYKQVEPFGGVKVKKRRSGSILSKTRPSGQGSRRVDS